MHQAGSNKEPGGLAKYEAADVSEPIEQVAGAGRDEGLGELLDCQQREEDEGDGRDPAGQSRKRPKWQGQIAEKAKGSDETEVADLVAVLMFDEESPPAVSITAIGDHYDDDEKDEKGERKASQKELFQAV